MNNSTNKGAISFLGYRLIRFEYECAADFEFDVLHDAKYHFAFSKDDVALSDSQHQFNLAVKMCFGNNFDFEQSPYKVYAEIAGRFDCEQGWDARWDINAIAILFPYLRALISTMTAQSGREPILLPTVNVAQLFK